MVILKLICLIVEYINIRKEALMRNIISIKASLYMTSKKLGDLEIV